MGLYGTGILENGLQDLEQSHTRLIIYSTGGPYDKMDGILNPERVPLIANFIKANFAKKVDIDGTTILLRQ